MSANHLPTWQQRSLTTANVFVFVARMFAAPLEAILRRRFGYRYFGMQALMAVVLMPFWMIAWPGHSRIGLMLFWWLTIVRFIRIRIESMRLLRNGVAIHTRYNGWPKLASVFKRSTESAIKAKWEPLFCFILGWVLMSVSEPLGSLVLVSTVALVLVHSTIDAVETARVMELNDAWIEQQRIAERFREVRRNDPGI